MITFYHMRTILIALMMTLATQVGNADIYKAFDYNLGEQYKSVVSRVNLTDPYNCDKYGDLPDHLRPGYMVPLIQANRTSRRNCSILD